MRDPKSSLPFVIVIAVAVASVAIYHFEGGKKPEPVAAASEAAAKDASVNLTQNQLGSITIAPAGMYVFRAEKDVIGSVAYHEKDVGRAKYMVASIPESDSPFIRVGQSVQVRPAAYPGRVFEGKVSALGVTVYDSGGNPAVDPNTHRTTARCEIRDPHDELYPGMFGSITIAVGTPTESVAVPENAVVREGDGTTSVWVTTDRRHFVPRVIKVGIRQDGYAQVLEGVEPGELVVTSNAVFLSNVNNSDAQ